MNKFGVFLTLALVGLVAAEPPIGGSGYAYTTPLLSHGSSVISTGFGGGYGGDHGIGLGGISGEYHSVNPGYQTSEGKYVDPILLHKVKGILLDHENHEASQFGGHYSGGHHGLSLSYGAPSSHYGVPSYGGRVVGIELGPIRHGIQVAQYHQSGYAHLPSGLYEHHAIPSGSYGVPHHY